MGPDFGPDRNGQQSNDGLRPSGGPPLQPFRQPDAAPMTPTNPNESAAQFGAASPWQSAANQPSGNDLPLLPGQPLGQSFVQPTRRGKAKLVIGLSVLAVLLLGGAAAAYQYVYLPNTPEQIFATGMQRTGETLDSLSKQAASQETVKALERSSLDGMVEITADDQKYSGKIKMLNDAESSDINVTVDMTQEGDKSLNLGLQAMAELADGQRLPDIYLKLQGLKALGADAFIPGVSAYDGKWLALSSQFLERYFPEEATAENPAGTTPSAEEVSKLMNDLSAVARKHVFTADQSVAVLQNKRFVGTEQLASDITANHYIVSVNKPNAKKFCDAIIDTAANSQAFKKLTGGAAAAEDITRSKESCAKEIDSLPENDSVSLWVDTSYKLVSKLRISDQANAKSYLELGQSYRGGDELPVYAGFHDDDTKTDLRLDIKSNLKQATSKVTAVFEANEQSRFKGEVTLDIKPADKPVEVKRPADAVAIEAALKQLGLDMLLADPTASADSGETTLQSDVQSVWTKREERSSKP